MQHTSAMSSSFHYDDSDKVSLIFVHTILNIIIGYVFFYD